MTMFRKILAAVASLILVTGCADASVHVGGRGPGHLVKSTSGSFVGTPGVALGVSYDTSIGLSVDSNGRADLTPRAGAQVFYVNSTTGSDSNTCTQAKSAATPKASIKSAVSCVVDGEGDHVLVAQGMSYPLGLAYIGETGGFSPAYPFVIQSYDPADPTNQAKWGAATGSNRPLVNISGADMSGGFIQGGPSDFARQYRAIRGLEFNAGNVADSGLSVLRGVVGGTPDYLLFENDVFAYSYLSIDCTDASTRAQHIVIRNSAFYGEWGNSLNDHQQGIFAAWVDGLTVEDSVFWHNGWNVNATRASDPTVGGPTIFNHPIYGQMNTVNTLVRRSVFIDSSSDGGELKGGGIYQKNLSLNNPIGVQMGHNGDGYSTLSPLGVWNDSSFNAVLGSDGSQNWGIWSAGEARPGSLAHHNVVAQSAAPGYALMADAGADAFGIRLPNYIAYDNNVAFSWGLGKATCISSGGVCTQIFATYTNNRWDDASSGSNTHVTGGFSNAYTSTTIATALGYADLTAARTDWVAHPEQHKWQPGVALALAGYGVTAPALQDLATDFRITTGIATYGQFIGTQDGDTLAVTGLPACVSFDGNTRTWRATSACTAGTTASVNVTETAPGGANHTTVIPLNVYDRPVLSSLVATPSSTSASVTLSANVGSGTLFDAVLTSSTPPTSWENVRGNNSAVAKGFQAVSATGTQTVSITGLTASTTYYANLAQLDANNNPSLVDQVSFTTTSGVTTHWAASTDTPPSAVDYTISGANSNVITQSSGNWSLARANVAKTSGSFIITITSGTTGSGSPTAIGFSKGSEATSSTKASGVVYLMDGTSIGQGASTFTGASYTTGDQIKVSLASNVASFYKWNGSSFVLQGTINVATWSGGGALYPSLWNWGSATFTADFSGW